MKRRILAGAAACMTMLSTVPALPMQTLPAAAALSGDVNADGTVSADDAAALQSWLLTGKGSITDADLNADSTVNAIDLTILKRTLLSAFRSASVMLP